MTWGGWSERRSAAGRQRFDFLAVLDFEATCEDNVRLDPQEIIELPTVLIDTRRNEVVDTFQTYVRPMAHPKLTKFCTELTGIQQVRLHAPCCSRLLSSSGLGRVVSSRTSGDGM